MHTVLEIVNLTIKYFNDLGVSHPRREAEELIGEALGIGRMGVYLDFERPLIESELALCRLWVTRRAKKEPIQHIIGKVSFFNCTIMVSPQVLIPRPETEILVDKIAKILEKIDLNGKVLWDICCGSGCIGISLKKRFPELQVVLSDISTAALEIAKSNAQANAVDVELLCGDLLNPFIGRKANFIVSNPPYISNTELSSLSEEVRLYEPHLALIAGESGLEFYERLAAGLNDCLEPQGKAWLEIGTGQGTKVEQLFKDAKWTVFKTELDWAGHDRFFSLEKE